MIFAVSCEARGRVSSLVLKHQEKHAFSKCYAISHMRLQLQIVSVLGHSFLACNLPWACSLFETSDTELKSRKVSYLKSQVSH